RVVIGDGMLRMRRRAARVGASRLSRTADVVSAALDDMTGATSPRLQLELMVARILAASEVLAPAPSSPAPAPAPVAERPAPAPSPERPSPSPDPERGPAEPDRDEGPSAPPTPEPVAPPATQPAESPASAPTATPTPVDFARVRAAWPAILTRLEGVSRVSWMAVTVSQPLAFDAETSVLTVGFQTRNDLE